MERKRHQTDSAATIDEDGNVSNSRLHEQMTEDVDDYDFRMETRAKLMGQGVPVSALDRVLPREPKRDISTPHAISARGEFDKRVLNESLAHFCGHYGYDTAGFNSQTLDRISEYDALWFLKALEMEVVTTDGAFFHSRHSGANEQIFWQYGKPGSPRKINIWVEPVITIGAAGRLHSQFGWPKEHIGLQSKKNWAFDLVAYGDPAGLNPVVACEVKKHKCEVEYLTEAMRQCFPKPSLGEEPSGQRQRNAYRKVKALREMKSELLWILGPENYGRVFRVLECTHSQAARLEEIEEGELEWRGLP